MGMYDDVKFDEPCSKCGSDNVVFQSKDGKCDLSYIEPYEVRWFKGYCHDCRNIDEYTVEVEVVVVKERILRGDELIRERTSKTLEVE